MTDDVPEKEYVRGKGSKRFRRGDVERDQAAECDRSDRRCRTEHG